MAGIPGKIVGSESQIEQTISPGTSTSTLIQNVDDSLFEQVDSAYAETGEGVDGALGDEALITKAAHSLFNPLYMFRYAKYGATDGAAYYPEKHKDLAEISADTNRGPSVQSADYKHVVENPSATEIIRWAKNSSSDNKEGTILGPTPYQLNDFLWCKFYGKIPNNRMLTLRRYPIPVEDNLQISGKKMPLVPLAQAITWWGGESGNTLGETLGITYGFKWLPKIAEEVKDVNGNEVDASALLDAVGITQGDNALVRNILLATVFDNPDNPYEATGYDEKMKTWTKEAWGSEGQYWNRVLGPVNVINETTIRNRGFEFTHDIVLKFSYRLRSYGNINPKIAMLDLISNFLTLTHNTADFWGGGIRYFQKTGYILPGLPTTLFEEGDYIGGIKDVVAYMAAVIKEQMEETKGLINEIGTNVTNLSGSGVVDALKGNNGAQNLAGSWVQNLMQVPLTMRSFLDGRAVGEWHLTVGNPMNPFATIGNLLVKTTTINFSEDVGLDDTPTEVHFTVNLGHGRPRAKQDIESIFNLGGGKMYFSPLPPPSSAKNTFGADPETIRLDKDQKIPNNGGASIRNYEDGINKRAADSDPGRTADEISGIITEFGKKVTKAYGASFGNSPIMSTYFKDLKTRD